MKTFADFKTLADAEAKLTAVRVERDAAQREYDARLSASNPTPVGNPSQQRAAAYLAGDDGPAPSVPTDELRENLAMLSAAISLQERAVAEARTAASIEIAKEARPAYTAIVNRLAKALTTLDDLLGDEEVFRDKLNGEGVTFTSVFQPMAFRPYPKMDTDEFRSRIADWLKEARDNGYRV